MAAFYFLERPNEAPRVKNPLVSSMKGFFSGGPDDKVLSDLDRDLPFYSRKLDLAVMTHPQADHMTGLIDLIKNYQVQNLWVNGDTNTTGVYLTFEKAIEAKKQPETVVSQGDKLVFSDSTSLAVLWPPKDLLGDSNLNHRAIVIKVSFGDFDALLTSDADQKVQPYTSDTRGIEFLKVPHHGSKTGMDRDYIEKLKPAVSVISVGAHNTYGHPNPDVVNFLINIGSKVFRTDKNGTVEIVTNGRSWYTKTEK